MNDGIQTTTKTVSRVGPLIGVPQLRAQYLHGLETTDNEGNPIGDETMQEYLDVAVSLLEHDLDVCIYQKDIVEEKDYQGNDYAEWGYFQLNNIPVVKMHPTEPLVITYLRNAQGVPLNALTIPPAWIRLREHDGIIRLVPNNNIPAQLMVDGGGGFMPEIFSRNSTVPQLWTVKYTAGFADGQVPKLVNSAIGLLAAVFALNNSADLIAGAGIANYSLSLDGISQSIGTTGSAENHTNSAKVKSYFELLFGSTINSPNQGIIRTLRKFYQGQSLQIL